MSEAQPATPVMSSTETNSLKEAYEQWDMDHARIKSSPPTQGRDYISHAVNLLTFLEPISEVNPFFKTVVGTFKLVVFTEQERRENDARIEAVVLAQADMMRVLLDVDQVIKRNDNTTSLYTVSSITIIFDDIQTQIKLCHNCMDTYRKQHKIAKFCRARDWKEKFMQFVSTFGDLRNRLLTAIDLQTASNISQIVTDMKKIFNFLFAAQNPQEKKDMKKINAAGRETLKSDPKALQSLLVSIGDSAMAENIAETPPKVKDDDGKKGTSKPDARQAASVSIELQVNELMEDMRASVDALCEKNKKHFERSLAFYTDHLKKSIDDSADHVIRSLSGPYDRLQHKDLRELWKEMKWIFCVETSVFALALFEYYQDLYTHPHITATDSGEETAVVATRSPNTSKPSSDPKRHPDAWTLPYLASFTTAVATIDDDNSGYIRVSEANRFTSRIPEGWTLPQYCAYLVEGRHHESSIYRHRMIYIRSKVYEMHAQLLPGNRYSAASVVETVCGYTINKITLQPESQTKALSIAPELDELIKMRIREQDVQVREALAELEYNLDEATVMLFLGQDLEQFVFPLAYALMELLLDFHHLCCSSTVDFREWSRRIQRPFALLHTKIDERIKELKSRDPAINLIAYHRGIWFWFDEDNLPEDPEQQFMDAVARDIYSHRAAMSFIVDFPLPNFVGDFTTLTYPTWEQFSEHNDTSSVPEDQFAFRWSSSPDGWRFIPKDDGFFNLPLTRYCDKCHRELKSAVYHCLECEDFDFCQECYDKLPTEHEVEEHEFGHTMALVVAYVQESRRIWIYVQNEREAERYYDIHGPIQETEMVIPADEPDYDEDDQYGNMLDNGDEEDEYAGSEDKAAATNTGEGSVSPVNENLYTCCVCDGEVTLESRFFICGEYSCQEGLAVCQKCVHQQYEPVDTHFWWHSLLPFDERVLYPSKSFTEAPSPTESHGSPKFDLASAYDAQADKSQGPGATDHETKLSAVERKLGVLDERLSGIEAMLQKLLDAGAGGAPPGGEPTSPPVQQGRQGRRKGQNQRHADEEIEDEERDTTGYSSEEEFEYSD